jgi:hypothetical protein
MKNLILSLMGMLCINLAFSQTPLGNGGQANENASIKIEFAGFFGTQTIIKATNKQSCIATAKFSNTGNGSTTQYKTLPANGSDTIHILIPIVKNAKVQANMESGCNGFESGVVELKLDLVAMPLKFISFNLERINDTDCYVIFEVAEVLNVQSINIKVSIDGKIYKVFASLKPDQTYYKVLLNLKDFVNTGLTPLDKK